PTYLVSPCPADLLTMSPGTDPTATASAVCPQEFIREARHIQSLVDAQGVSIARDRAPSVAEEVAEQLCGRDLMVTFHQSRCPFSVCSGCVSRGAMSPMARRAYQAPLWEQTVNSRLPGPYGRHHWLPTGRARTA